jgi:hypothetical protein
MSPITRSLALPSFVLLSLILALSVSAQVALQCWQFDSWEQAQATYEAAPWMNLDPDGNGVACDCLLNGTPC